MFRITSMVTMPDFEEIFRKYHEALLVYAQKFVGDEHAALDVVQDVFIQVWEKKKPGMNEENLKAYLFSSVKNGCFNYLKHEKVVSRYRDRQSDIMAKAEFRYYESIEKSLIEQETIMKIHDAINSLSDVYREVIELSRFEGLKNKEIAERLNIPLRTVETRLFRALSALREKLTGKLFRIFLTISIGK